MDWLKSLGERVAFPFSGLAVTDKEEEEKEEEEFEAEVLFLRSSGTGDNFVSMMGVVEL